MMDVMFLFHLICWKAHFNNFDYFQVLHSPVHSRSWVSAQHRELFCYTVPLCNNRVPRAFVKDNLQKNTIELSKSIV